MSDRTSATDHASKGKAALPVLLTLLAGVGGGLFAMRPDTVPSEPVDDNFKASANTAEALGTAGSIALVEPKFSLEADLAVSVSPASADPLPMAPYASDFMPGPKARSIELMPDLVAVIPAAELTQDQPPAEIAAPPMSMAVAVTEPVVQPIDSLPVAMPEASPASLPQDNTSLAIEQPAEVAPVAQPEAVVEPKLAIADWNYSLPDQSAPSDVSAFAGAASNAPITLVPSRAAPVREAQRAVAGAGGARSQLAAPTGKVPAAVGIRKNSGAGFAAAIHGKGKYQFVGSDIEFQLPVVANGAPVGDLTLHVAPNQQVSLRLGELLSLFHDQIDPQTFSALVASPSNDSFVTFEKLRDAGIDIRYDAARDRIALSVEQP